MSGHEPASSGAATPSAASNSPSTPASSGTVTSTSGSSVITPGSSQFQRLKVEDALSYLDQVKLQFGNHPEVYNNFLDIMKEFKSQSIDTPGVISRVSSLFKGHPDLIVGFNTFLPPGFKIEVHGQNEINIQGPAQHSHTLQQIALRHNAQNAASATSSPVQSTGSQPLGYSRHSSSSGTGSTPPSNVSSSQKGAHGMSMKPHGVRDESHQPVEFNHAINYVNKIKNRFQGQPDVYKAFLEILHTYQKEQRVIKEQGGTPCNTPLSESEVYLQVSKLFQNQEDLLSEFGQFLPDATSGHGLFANPLPMPHTSKKQTLSSSKSSKAAHARRTSQSSLNNNSQPPAKKSKSSAKEVLAEAGKHSNYAETALFDKIRKAIHNQDVYENFLRCLVLFNEEIISRQELIQLVTPFLGKFPDLFSQYKSMLGFKEPSTAEASPETSPPPQLPPKERVTEFAAEIDFNSLKRHGASYRALPKTYVQPKCSGRTQLCRELLNDTWVSFPMWSEDSTFQGTRKTQYEEYIFRCEDERFELDIVLEGNLSTIKILEAIQKKMARMSPEELSKFSLDDRLGGSSEFIHRKALHRIYGERAVDVVQGLKTNPSVAIPVVLKRLKLKQEEWLDAQRSFNRIWREQLEKYYLKSLDHLGITFKQVDTRAMKSKTLINEIENIYDERLVDGKTPQFSAHLVYAFPVDKTSFCDSVGLIMYYMKRASALSNEEASKIRMFLVQLMADFCYYPRVELNSDDDISLDTDSDAMEVDQPLKDGCGGLKLLANSILPDPPTYYSMLDCHVIFTNSTIYTFFRLFQFLCERLHKLYQQAQVVVQEQALGGGPTLQESVAVKLGLKKMPDIPVEEYYPTFLNMAKNLMEGNIDGPTYEDSCREMFGVHAYVVFTIDRLVQNIVRQLHSMVGDDTCLRILEQYTNFVENITDNGPSLSMAETAYQKKIEGLVGDDNCYKVTMTKNQKLLIELMEPEDSSEENGADTKKWESYVSDYVKEEQSLAATREMNILVQQRKIFLRRSHRNLAILSSSIDEFEKSRSLDQAMLCFDTQGSIEFKMDERSYRMIPLANSEDYLYRRTALTRALEVTPSMLAKKQQRFTVWYKKWSEENVPEDMDMSCKEWFFGRAMPYPGTDSIPCVPSRRISEDHYGQERNRYVTD